MALGRALSRTKKQDRTAGKLSSPQLCDPLSIVQRAHRPWTQALLFVALEKALERGSQPSGVWEASIMICHNLDLALALALVGTLWKSSNASDR
ncbi:hypothetical protein ColKHC_04248 [Colletotrichum higginsianum]|nr:hypothetical protein ColKHC_04248 [Colletotrichum higginsianum]